MPDYKNFRFLINVYSHILCEYLLSDNLLCERGLHIYDSANGIATLQVRQEGLQGYFMMPHRWK
jgi:hypothetical protein